MVGDQRLKVWPRVSKLWASSAQFSGGMYENLLWHCGRESDVKRCEQAQEGA